MISYRGATISYLTKRITRCISILMVPFFLVYSASSIPVNAAVIENPDILNTTRDINADIREGLVSLPVALGEIKDTYFGNSGKTIIHIQDAHCNYYAQKSIKDIIKYFNNEYGVNLIFVEGGERGYDLTSFTDINESVLRGKVADFFLKQGNLNAAEYISVLDPGKFNLWGVEEEELYKKNLSVYRESMQYNDEVKKDLKKLNSLLNSLREHVYSEELLDFDRKYTLYKNNDMSFKDYIVYLFSKAKTYFIDLKRYPNLYLLEDVLEQENDIDFKKAGKERELFIEELHSVISENKMEELLRYTINFKSGDISQREYYNFLIKSGQESDIDIDKYSFFKRFAVYTSIYEAIDKSIMMYELNTLEDRLRDMMSENDLQRKLVFFSKNFDLMQRAFDFSITKDDFEYFKEYMSNFDMKSLLKFIRETMPLYNKETDIPDSMMALETHLREIKKFYIYSFERDNVFLENINEKMEDDGAFTGVLFTGGFHTDNLAELFKKEGISYISVIPHFKDPEGYECPYFTILGGGYTDIGKMIMDAVSVSNMQVASIWNSLGKSIEGSSRANLAGIEIELAKKLAAGETALVSLSGTDKGLLFFVDDETGNVDYKLTDLIGETDIPQVRIKNIDTLEYDDHERIIDQQIMDAYESGRAYPVPLILDESSGTIINLIDKSSDFFRGIGQTDIAEALQRGDIIINEVEGVSLFKGHASWRGIHINKDYFEDKSPDEKIKTIIHEVGAYFLQTPETNELLEQEYDRWSKGLRNVGKGIPDIDVTSYMREPGRAEGRDYSSVLDIFELGDGPPERVFAYEIAKTLFYNSDPSLRAISYDSSVDTVQAKISEIENTLNALISRFTDLLRPDEIRGSGAKQQRDQMELMISLFSVRLILAFGNLDNMSEESVLGNFVEFLVRNEWEDAIDVSVVKDLENAIDKLVGERSKVLREKGDTNIENYFSAYVDRKIPYAYVLEITGKGDSGINEIRGYGSERTNLNSFLLLLRNVVSEMKDAAARAQIARKKVKMGEHLLDSIGRRAVEKISSLSAEGTLPRTEDVERYAGAVRTVLSDMDPSAGISHLRENGYRMSDFNSGMGLFFKPLGFGRMLAELSVLRNMTYIEYEQYVKNVYSIVTPDDIISYYDYKMMEKNRDIILSYTWVNDLSAYILMGGITSVTPGGYDFLRLSDGSGNFRQMLRGEFILKQGSLKENTLEPGSSQELLLMMYIISRITSKYPRVDKQGVERFSFDVNTVNPDREYKNYLEFHRSFFSTDRVPSRIPIAVSKEEFLKSLLSTVAISEMIGGEVTHALRPWSDEAAGWIRARRPESKWASGLNRYRSLTKVFEDFFKNSGADIASALNLDATEPLNITRVDYVGEISGESPGYDKVMFEAEAVSGDERVTFIVSTLKNSDIFFVENRGSSAGTPIIGTWPQSDLRNTGVLTSFEREAFRESAPLMYKDTEFTYDGETHVILSEFSIEKKVNFPSEGVPEAIGDMVDSWLDIISGAGTLERPPIVIARADIPADADFEQEPLIVVTMEDLGKMDIRKMLFFLHEDLVPRLAVDDSENLEARLQGVIADRIGAYNIPSGNALVSTDRYLDGKTVQEVMDTSLAYLRGYASVFSLRDDPDFFAKVNSSMRKALSAKIDESTFPEELRGNELVAERLNRRLEALRTGYRESIIDAFITISGEKTGFSDADAFIKAIEKWQRGDTNAIREWKEKHPAESFISPRVKANVGRLLAGIHILTSTDEKLQTVNKEDMDQSAYNAFVIETLVEDHTEYRDIAKNFDIENVPLDSSEFLRLFGADLYMNGLETVAAANDTVTPSDVRKRLIPALDYVFGDMPEQGTFQMLLGLGKRVFSAGSEDPVEEAARIIIPRFKEMLRPADKRTDRTMISILEGAETISPWDWLQGEGTRQKIGSIPMPSKWSPGTLLYGMGSILADFSKSKGWKHSDYLKLARKINKEMSEWAVTSGENVDFTALSVVTGKVPYDEGKLREVGRDNGEEKGFARWLDDEDIGEESQIIRDKEGLFSAMAEQEGLLLNGNIDISRISDMSGFPGDNIKIIEYDLGLATGAFQFPSGGNLIVVLNNNAVFRRRVEDNLRGKDGYSYDNVLDEILFHEAREAYWTKNISERWAEWENAKEVLGLRDGITPASIAHIIASAEQASEFGLDKTENLGGLTPYHYAALQGMSRGTITRKLEEDREMHSAIIASVTSDGIMTDSGRNNLYREIFTGKLEDLLERTEPVATPDDINRSPADVAVGTDLDEKQVIDITLNSAKDIRFRKRNVQVLTGFLTSPDLDGAMRQVNRKFNSDIKLRFGSKKDNQQVRTFALVEGADRKDNAKAFLTEMARTYRSFENNYKGEEDTLVVFAPQIDAWSADSDPKNAILSWASEVDLSESDRQSISNALASEKVMIVKDTYSDWNGESPDEIKLPDIAMRFVLARHMAALKNARNEGTREDIFRDIITLLISRSGDNQAVYDRLENALRDVGSKGITELLNGIIIDITPLPYNEIPEYASMMREVAVSL